jgi:hypothetical protein
MNNINLKKDIIKITYLTKDYEFEKELYENILDLPTQLRHKIYIICMRLYWRDYIPLTSKVPSWYKYSIHQENLLFKARVNNIHFLHLPCNTLNQYKKYIVGCQCYHCLYCVDEDEKILKQAKNCILPEYFNEIVPYTESKWNDREDIFMKDNTIHYGLPIFNPYYDIEDKIMNETLQFTTYE